MAKYIIDIEDEYTKDWVNETPMCKELCMPISNRQRTYHLSTGFKLEPYTESDRKAIEDEVWDFAKKVRLKEFFDDNHNLHPYLDYFDSYQDAKAKHEALKKQKEEIRVGDEIRHKKDYYSSVYGNAIVMYIDSEKSTHFVYKNSGKVGACSEVDKWWEKTGRHFNSIEDFLKETESEK